MRGPFALGYCAVPKMISIASCRGAFALRGLSHDRAEPLGQLVQPVEPRLRIAPGTADHELHVGAQLGGALQALDIADQASRVGELVIVEADQRAACADLDLGDARSDRLVLDL